MFQSAPPVETRGDTKTSEPVRLGLSMFQSAPPVETRGDEQAASRAVVGRYCFNPLPPSKRGETKHGVNCCGIIWVSIRSPRRNEGRPLRRRSAEHILSQFQSAPPVETRGDALKFILFRGEKTVIKAFQSAPPVETRGD